jgi:cell division septation protein DedD
MSDKPSLYVVEKKEVIILVVLFVLVTVLSFTLGVRYGESVGKKLAHEQAQATKELGGAEGGEGGGTLGKAEHDEAGSLEPGAKAPESGTAPAAAEAGKGEAPKGEQGAKEEHGASPEDAAKTAAATSMSHEAVDKTSDEYLLNALKDAGVEPPGGKAPKDAKLPAEMKQPATRVSSKIRSGTYVIQVGSHPTRSEAESQVRSLRARKVPAEILPPFKDRQGEWHRVVIGGFKTKRDAEKEAGGLKSKGSILSFFVWRLP